MDDPWAVPSPGAQRQGSSPCPGQVGSAACPIRYMHNGSHNPTGGARDFFRSPIRASCTGPRLPSNKKRPVLPPGSQTRGNHCLRLARCLYLQLTTHHARLGLGGLCSCRPEEEPCPCAPAGNPYAVAAFAAARSATRSSAFTRSAAVPAIRSSRNRADRLIEIRCTRCKRFAATGPACDASNPSAVPRIGWADSPVSPSGPAPATGP
jgi:hypothetical protein